MIGGFTAARGRARRPRRAARRRPRRRASCATRARSAPASPGRRCASSSPGSSRLGRTASPFADRWPALCARSWVRPELVAQVTFTEWTADGRLRHPSFQGLREDKPAARRRAREGEPAPPAKGDPAARAAGRETAAAGRPAPGPPPRGGPRAARSREGRAAIVPRSRASRQSRSRAFGSPTPAACSIPVTGTTKRGPRARTTSRSPPGSCPHLRGRPTTLVRCPDGLAGDCFYQKHAGVLGAAGAAPRAHPGGEEGRRVPRRGRPARPRGLVQIGILEIHTWNSSAEHLEQPDRLVFDLDPGPVRRVGARRRGGAARARATARARPRELRQDDGRQGPPRGRAARSAAPRWDESWRFAGAVAAELAREEPEAFVAEMSKARAPRAHLPRLPAQPARLDLGGGLLDARAGVGPGIDAPAVGRAVRRAALGRVHDRDAPGTARGTARGPLG